VKGIGRVWRSLAQGALERRLAHLFGMDVRLAHELLAAARLRDDGRLTLRVAAFLAATTRLSPRLLPRSLRERAIRSFVWWLFDSHQDDPRLPLAYAGHHALGPRSCPGFLPS
jgi:hypothetical protein